MKFSLPPDTPAGQAQAINANEKLITVGAGAGTGKTWVLSSRYVRLLLEDQNILPANILTLTFTEAAASEMKSRIEQRIKDELKNFQDPKYDSRKREILDGLSDSWISTIHSFAARLIRESGLSLDIDPGASVISAQQEQDFWEGIKNAVEFANLRELARTYGDKNLRQAAEELDRNKILSAGVNKWRSSKLAELAREVSELQASSGHTWEEMLAWSDNDNFLIEQTRPLVRDILIEEWREVWNIWRGIVLPAPKKSTGSGANLIALLDWQKNNSPDNEQALEFFYAQIVIDKNKAIKATGYEPFKTLKEEYLGMTLGSWRDSRPDIFKSVSLNFEVPFSSQELEMRRTLLKFCAVSWGMWDMMKKHRGLLSFSDMILHARRAIDNNSVKRIFNHVLVDEFQDTDPLQFEMIQTLAKTSGDANLFAVGDPKQSIYKFRYADPALFAQTIKQADTRVNLDVSFRTRKPLLDQINKIFKTLWANGLGKSASMKGLVYEKVNAAPNDGTRDSGTMPVFKVIIAPKEKISLADAKKNLAEALAFHVYTWVKEGRTIWDKAEKIIRPVGFSDFAVLSRSRMSNYSVLEEAFQKFNIKTIQDRSYDFFARGEIGDIVCMLRAAADFHDDFSVMGWLLSPFSGVKEEDALKCLEAVNKNNRPIEIIKADLPEAYSRLEYLSVVGENEGAAGLISLLDKNRGWLSCYRDHDKLRVLRNLRLALSIARDFQKSGTASLNSCAEWLTRAIHDKINFEESAWHDENENAVKLGVVHSAKGLEYPVTVIFETRLRKKGEAGSLRASKNLGAVFSALPDEIISEADSEEKLKGFDWERLLAEQGDMEEEERLFYVAATRAQDSLIFCGVMESEPHEGTWTKFLADNADLSSVEIYSAVGLDSSLVEQAEYDDDKKILQPLKIIQAKNSLRQISASSFSLFEWCPFAWRRRYRQGLELKWEARPEKFEELEDLDEDFSGGASLGSLAHWILERWPKNNNYEAELEYYLNDREIVSRLPAYLRRIWRDKKSKLVLKDWLMNFAASDLGQELIKNNFKREFSFRVKLAGGVTALAGAMDAFFENRVIDYKITSIENVPEGLYESQLDFYALAAHELTGAESVETCTAFLREGKFFERECKNFDDIKARVLRASEICASGPFEAKREHCTACPFKKGCVKYHE